MQTPRRIKPRKINNSTFVELVDPLQGCAVASVWFGDFTALYLEVGAAVGMYSSGRLRAEYCVYLGFDWEFGVKKGASHFSREPDSKARIADLVSGRRIVGVATTTALELELRFESDVRIRTADRAAEPDWTIYLPSEECVGVESSSLVVEIGAGPVVEALG